MKKALSIFLALSLTSVFAFGCTTTTTTPDTAAKTDAATTTDAAVPVSADGAKYAVIVKNAGNPYNGKEIEGFQEAMKELGAEVIVKEPAEPSAEAQIAMIDELIKQKVTGIAIAGNDPDALQNVLEKAMKENIKVVSFDASVNAASRMAHINQADADRIGKSLIELTSEMIGGEGEIAILSATSQAANQNLWIETMKKELENPTYAKIKLVKVAYGDDLRDKSTSETEALLQSYPNLKAIIAPTTVGVAAAGKVLTDKNLSGKVFLTGLGLPSEMAEYINNGVCPAMYLWNPIDVGYLAGQTIAAMGTGAISGVAGDKFTAGRLGDKEVITVGDGTEVMLGDPFKFDKTNIEEWKGVY